MDSKQNKYRNKKCLQNNNYNTPSSSKEVTIKEYLDDFKIKKDILFKEHSFVRSQLESVRDFNKTAKLTLDNTREVDTNNININYNTINENIKKSKEIYDELVKKSNKSQLAEEQEKYEDIAFVEQVNSLQDSINELLNLSYNIYCCKFMHVMDESLKLGLSGIFIPQQQTQDVDTPPESLKAEHDLLNDKFELIFNSVNQCVEEMKELGQEPQKLPILSI